MFDADGRPVLTDPGLRLTSPNTPADDLKALGALALQSGADPKLFPPTLFTTPGDDIAQHLLSLTPPTPIDLGFTPATARPAPESTAPPTTAPETTGPATTNPDTAHSSGPDYAGDNQASSGPDPEKSVDKQPVDQHPVDQQSTDHVAPVREALDHVARGEGTMGERRGVLDFTTTTAAEPTTAGSPAARSTSRSSTGIAPIGPEPTSPGSTRPSTAGRGLTRLRSSAMGSTRAGPIGSGRGRAGVGRGGADGPGTTSRLGRGVTRGGSSRHTRSARGRVRSTGKAGTHRGGSVAMIREGLQAKRSTYGVLVACGVAALIVLGVGLATVGVLGQAATGSTTTAGTPQSSSATRPVATSSPSPSPQKTNPSPQDPSPSARSVESASPGPVTPSGKPGEPPGESTRAAEDSKRWLQTLQSLDRRRSQAFSTLNPADLDAIYVPGSPPWSSDRSLLASYRKQQVRVEGLRMQIETLIVEHPGDETVVLRIVDRLIAGAAVTRSGDRTALPPGPPTTRRITLTASNTSWRISAITTT